MDSLAVARLVGMWAGVKSSFWFIGCLWNMAAAVESLPPLSGHRCGGKMPQISPSSQWMYKHWPNGQWLICLAAGRNATYYVLQFHMSSSSAKSTVTASLLVCGFQFSCLTFWRLLTWSTQNLCKDSAGKLFRNVQLAASRSDDDIWAFLPGWINDFGEFRMVSLAHPDYHTMGPQGGLQTWKKSLKVARW